MPRSLTALVLSSAILLSGMAVLQHHSTPRAEPPPGASGAPGIAIVGDSLAWQADASIKAMLSSAGRPARVSVNPGHALSTPWAQGAIASDEKAGIYKVLVVETASNDAALVARGSVPVAQYVSDLNRLATQTRQGCLVVMTAKVSVDAIYYQPVDALAVNRAIREVAAHHRNVRVVDWNQSAEEHRSWFWADLLHLTPGLPAKVSASNPPAANTQTSADRAFAQAIEVGIDSCASTPTLRLHRLG